MDQETNQFLGEEHIGRLNLGMKRPEAAKKSVGNSIIMVIVSSLVLSAVYLVFSDQIIAMFGGTVNV